MEASTELPLAAESIQSVLFAERAQQVEPKYLADEEFPPGLTVMYDWTLQRACQPASRRVLGLLAVVMASLLLAGSFCVVYWGPKLIPSELASPWSSSR